jgi:hypothetical protein
MLRIRGAMPPAVHMPSWHRTEPFEDQWLLYVPHAVRPAALTGLSDVFPATQLCRHSTLMRPSVWAHSHGKTPCSLADCMRISPPWEPQMPSTNSNPVAVHPPVGARTGRPSTARRSCCQEMAPGSSGVQLERLPTEGTALLLRQVRRISGAHCWRQMSWQGSLKDMADVRQPASQPPLPEPQIGA